MKHSAVASGPGTVIPYRVVMDTAPEYWLSGIRTLCADGLEVCLSLFGNKKSHTESMAFEQERVEHPPDV